MLAIHRFLLRYGMAGLPSDAHARAHHWERQLNWPLFLVLFLAVPAFYIEVLEPSPELLRIGSLFILAIALAFAGHLAVMLSLCDDRREYLHRNWMHVLIVLGSSLNLLAVGRPDSMLGWVVRIVWQGTAFLRLLGFLTVFLRPGSLGAVLLLAAMTLAGAGLGFYWLEPTVHSYGEGIWLAFTSAATVGYGDYVPTTPASRVFAVFIVLLGWTVISLVTASIAALFVGEEEKELRREMHHDIKALRLEIAELREQVREAQRKE